VSGVMLGIFFPPAVPFVEAIFGIAYSVLEYFTSGQFDDDIEREFKCILIDEANVAPDGVVTFEFEDVRTLVNAKMFESPVWIAISYFLNTFGEDALNRAGATTAVEDADCSDCSPGWCYEWDFTLTDGGWSAYSGLGEWEPGVGWKAVTTGGTAKSLLIGIDFPTPNSLRDFEITYTQSGDAGDAARRLFYYAGSFVPVSGVQSSGNGTDETTAVLADTTTIDLNNMYYNWSSSLPKEYTLTKVLVRGDFDPNPFGDDNCDT